MLIKLILSLIIKKFYKKTKLLNFYEYIFLKNYIIIIFEFKYFTHIYCILLSALYQIFIPHLLTSSSFDFILLQKALRLAIIPPTLFQIAKWTVNV